MPQHWLVVQESEQAVQRIFPLGETSRQKIRVLGNQWLAGCAVGGEVAIYDCNPDDFDTYDGRAAIWRKKKYWGDNQGTPLQLPRLSKAERTQLRLSMENRHGLQERRTRQDQLERNRQEARRRANKKVICWENIFDEIRTLGVYKNLGPAGATTLTDSGIVDMPLPKPVEENRRIDDRDPVLEWWPARSVDENRRRFLQDGRFAAAQRKPGLEATIALISGSEQSGDPEEMASAWLLAALAQMARPFPEEWRGKPNQIHSETFRTVYQRCFEEPSGVPWHYASHEVLPESLPTWLVKRYLPRTFCDLIHLAVLNIRIVRAEWTIVRIFHVGDRATLLSTVR